MRKFTRRFLFIISSLLLTSLIVTAQKNTARQRCGTMEYLQRMYDQNPQLKQQYEQNILQGEKMKQQYLLQKANQKDNTGGFGIETLTAPVYVPVVVHIVLPRADQITDADVKAQIDKLNIDFAGLNGDSVNLPAAFKALFGKSKIQFKLARRDPAGNLTSGVDRRNSSAASNINLATDPIKRFSSGGLDAWDYTKYLNLWVGLDASGMGILGYTTFPGTDLPANQGIFINGVSWGINSCYVIPEFGLGRTLVHETGHYFGLYHNWGDDGTACTGDDFRQLSGTCLLPAPLLLGDTPNQAGNFSGVCPTGVKTDACTPTAPGVMYQNYMDYTDDACYALFTLQQVARMEWVVENCRATYLTSDGATPPASAPLKDVSPSSVVNPGGFELSGCTVITYPNIACATSAQPKVRVTNNGLDTLTSFTVGLLINGVSQGELIVGTSLPLGYSKVVTFPSYTFTNGSYILKFYTKLPNGVADQVTSNDTLTVTFTVGITTTGPVTEGFESATFPPAGWNVINPNTGSLGWERTTAAAKTGNASAYINFFNYDTRGQLDYLVGPLLDVSGADSVLVSFDRAYRPYSTTTSTYVDTLLIQASVDCGATFPIVAWKKGGNDLATNPLAITTNYIAVAADWKNETVDIKPFIGSAAKINVAFVGKTGYGQNLFIDNINMRTVKLLHRDAILNKVTEPFTRLCARTFVPTVEIGNKGLDTIKTLKVNYSLNGGAPVTVNYTGALATNKFATVSFPAVTLSAAGINTIKFYTSEPNGLPDQVPLNDTAAVVSFTVYDPVPGPVKEGFEQTTFPPANWSLVKSNNKYTWERTTRASSEGVASAWIRNRVYNGNGAIDELYAPLIQLSAPDSVFVNFDVAHATAVYPGSTAVQLDTLEVLLTKDCGKTFSSVYKKWGEKLQSVGDPNFAAVYASSDTIGFVPTAKNQWKTETVNLSSLLTGTTGTFQLVFRNINNNGNNIFLDNINITPVTLPARLKQQGFLIAPNPSEGVFNIQHYPAPTNLKGIQVINSGGQVIWQQQYSGNALSSISVDLSRNAAGIYLVRMLYDNKVVVQRVIKIK